jgi:hypothetical protein
MRNPVLSYSIVAVLLSGSTAFADALPLVTPLQWKSTAVIRTATDNMSCCPINWVS